MDSAFILQCFIHDQDKLLDVPAHSRGSQVTPPTGHALFPPGLKRIISLRHHLVCFYSHVLPLRPTKYPPLLRPPPHQFFQSKIHPCRLPLRLGGPLDAKSSVLVRNHVILVFRVGRLMLKRDVNVFFWKMLGMVKFLWGEGRLMGEEGGFVLFAYFEKIGMAGFVEVNIIVA